MSRIPSSRSARRADRESHVHEMVANIPADRADDAVAARDMILFVDDDAGIRSVADAMLTRLGRRALMATDGHTALAWFREHHATVALVILDRRMPGLCGGAVLTAMRSIDPHVRVVFTSGMAEDLNASGDDGPRADGFLPKPFSRAALESCLGIAR